MLTRISSDKKINLDIEEVYWEDVRDEVYKINSELAEICDQISPDKAYPLIKISYPYGYKIVNQGRFNFPNTDGELILVGDGNISNLIKDELTYSPIPLTLVLHNNTEVYVENGNRVTTLNFFMPGDLFGVFESTHLLANTFSDPIWNVTAGGRSVFMIPKVTDKIGYNRIRKQFGFKGEVPADLTDQWEIFKGIYNHSGRIDCWRNQVLVFTSNWFKVKNCDVAWLRFQKYLFKLGWLQLQILRDSVKFSLLWSSFVDEISFRNLKPRPYLIDTLKYLVAIANGAGVAFKPATDETALPTLLIQDAYVDFYNLKTYMPTIMQPCKLQGIDNKVYYSLALPTILDSTPYMKNPPSLIEDERNLKRLLATLIKTINNGNAIINPIKHVQYEFFHVDSDQYGEIINSRNIIEGDLRFNYSASARFADRIFCATSPFFRGCMRISLLP